MNPEIEKEAQEYKAGEFGAPSSGEEAWAERAIKQNQPNAESAEAPAQEREAEDGAKKEAAVQKETLASRIEAVREAKLARFESFGARDESGAVATIPADFSEAGTPVRPEFLHYPKPETLMYLEKGGRIQFYKALIPKTQEGEVHPLVSKLPENTVYIRSEFFNREEIETRKMQAEDMRDYLNDNTLKELGLTRPEAEPEALPLAA